MNVKELKEFLENLPDDAECIYETTHQETGKIYYQDLKVEYEPKTNDVTFS